VDNAVTTTKTIVDKRDQLVHTLTAGTDTADDLHDFLSDNDDRIIRLVRDGSGIAHTLAQLPSTHGRLISGGCRRAAARVCAMPLPSRTSRMIRSSLSDRKSCRSSAVSVPAVSVCTSWSRLSTMVLVVVTALSTVSSSAGAASAQTLQVSAQ